VGRVWTVGQAVPKRKALGGMIMKKEVETHSSQVDEVVVQLYGNDGTICSI